MKLNRPINIVDVVDTKNKYFIFSSFINNSNLCCCNMSSKIFCKNCFFTCF